MELEDTLFLPPNNFALVASGIYRSGALYPHNFEYLKRLKLKTVISLSAELPLRAVQTFFKEQSINVLHLGITQYRADPSWRPVNDELIKEALEMILDTKTHPALIMCTTGIHQTGTLVGCLRRLQSWNLNAILQEYREFAGANVRYLNEQFIELFDLDLVTLPQTLPEWFLQNIEIMEQEVREMEVIDGRNS